MIRVGLTGGIGSGKSTVAGFFGALGIPVYNSDREARHLMETPGSLMDAILELLGPGAYTNQKLNSAWVAGRVFSNPDLLQSLNALVHPAVHRDFARWSEQQQAPYVIQEAAILFEGGRHGLFDKTILVTAPEEERLQRVMARDRAGAEAVRQRMANQWPDSDKIPLADFVIENLDLETTRESVGQVHRQLLKLSSSGPLG